MMSWIRRWDFKRYFAIVSLFVMIYLGVLRCLAIVHADNCVSAGGRYDERSDECRDPDGKPIK
jgi:hypothetical protein